jgi:hydroxymethylpyrimidine pyrophosphatase-like HAD family hydrolase
MYLPAVLYSPPLLHSPQHQFVSSIGGEWRYVDCIAKNAGKGRAMVYLASKFGVSLEDVVAAGDSGNDLLMLGRLPEGCHPAIVMSNSHPEVSACVRVYVLREATVWALVRRWTASLLQLQLAF